MNNRIEQLDSLRGVAALIVVFNHLPFAMLGLPLVVVQLLRWLGLVNGHSSVMLFFVLSGFVLSLPFLNKKEINYVPYLVKRFFRIYVPYIISIILAIILSQFFYNQKVDAVGDWNMLWVDPISIKLIIEHIYFIGNINSHAFNGVIWSLIHELRISLVFPFIVLLIKRFDWKINIIICLVLSCIGGINNVFNIQASNGYNITYFATIHYTALFMLGSLLAKYRNEIVMVYQKANIGFKWLFLIFSFVAYNFAELVTHFINGRLGLQLVSDYFYIIMEYGMALGALGILVSAIGSFRLTKFLLFKPIQFLGKISYSLYLYHLPVILTCIYLLHEILPLAVISVLAILVSIGLSTVTWLLIENPCMRAGKKVAKKVSDKQIVFKLNSKKETA